MTYVIVSKNFPREAIQLLEKSYELIFFNSAGITYKPLASHPDIFICQTKTTLFIAPNTPLEFLTELEKREIVFELGHTEIGTSNSKSAAYNAVITNQYLIHNHEFTDPSILLSNTIQQRIYCKQSYTRCNLVAGSNHLFITSDHGISKALFSNKVEHFYFQSDEILLPGYKNGCIGGCCGIDANKFFLLGSLSYTKQGDSLRNWVESANYELIELYKGPLLDTGSFFFL